MDSLDILDLLDSIAKVVPEPETTLFSLAGRGHLENPVTDLLAFFFHPVAEHGFGDLFLRTFLECMSVDVSGLDLNNISARPRVRTLDDKEIDLFVTSTDWLLAIENKLGAPLYNPLSSYQAHANRFLVKQRFYAVLSPHGHGSPGWEAVTYAKYCAELRRKLPTRVFNGWSSKWDVFAREFIIHLEAELNITTSFMEPDQLEFIEKRLTAVEKVKALSNAYNAFLERELFACVAKATGGEVFVARPSKPGDFCFVCTGASLPDSRIIFWSAENPQSSGQFGFTIWRKNLTEAEEKRLHNLLPEYRPETSGGWIGWQKDTTDRISAMQELERATRLLFTPVAPRSIV